VNWAGLVLIAAAFAFWIAEIFVGYSHGALTLAGAACFVFGSLLLFQPAGSGYQVSLGVPVAIAAAFSLFFVFVLAKVVAVRRRPAAVGPRTIVGSHGRVRGHDQVAVRGELWRARDAEGEPLVTGEEVEVLDMEGLSLVVRRAGTRIPA
jgi:membrane-bound ClpP family serine protease